MVGLWQEPDSVERHALFHDMVQDAEPVERVLMIFGLLRNVLHAAANESADERRMRSMIQHALATIIFLRESLIERPQDPFYGAFKRFYNQLQRQIIDAARDNRLSGFAAAARSIETLISEAHADAFVGHCMGQSAWREHRVMFMLERLFAAGRTPLLAPTQPAQSAPAFTPLRFA